ncbi:MAG: DUF4136 domain-containing protein [Colwellia sp.]|uniref:DUF4136 domain-containing protein n=1 Tax=Colwellia sp. TaxID=56799 RepID=UPI0025C32F2E|nr:DUF4136 domain-containing protein [Colwellia sp.]NQZ28357.1 DUF4136 domain-containing protein [Colwellia sp.]
MKNLILSNVSKRVTNTDKKFVKFNLMYSALPLVLLLGACSSNYVPETDQSSSYDFSKIETYSVIGDEQLKNPMFSDIDRARFDAAIDISMQQHNIEEVSPEKADVLVSYFVVTKDKVKVNSSYSGGYASSCYRCGYGYGGGVTHINTRNYVEGTLVLDIIDNDSKLSIYRSTLTKPLKSYETAEERQQAMNKAVSDMMQSLS